MNQLQFINSVKEQVIIAVLADDELGDRLVLKGGNLLRFAFNISNRASKDIDVSIDGDFDELKSIKDRIFARLSRAFEAWELVIFDFKFEEVPSKLSDDMRTFWGGYKCEFKLVDRALHDSEDGDPDRVRRKARPLSDDGSTVFKIDFSKHEFCGDKQEFNIGGYTVYGYSPRSFVAEKIRAICQQMAEYASIVKRSRPAAARARDFVDIHVITINYGVDFQDRNFHCIIQEVFARKNVPLHLIAAIAGSRDQHEPDFRSVEATVDTNYDLQEFGFYFEFVCAQCKYLEPLWHV